MSYRFDFGVIVEQWQRLLDGCMLTLWLSTVSMAFGLAIALVTVLAGRSGIAPLRWLAKAFVEAVRNTPFLVQVFFIFFGLPALGLSLTAGTAAVIALALNGGAFCAEIIRGGVDSVSRGQVEAGAALGLRPFQVFRYIILRPALRTIYPALSGQFILLLLTSSIVSSISAEELTSIAQQVESTTFRSFEVYLTVTFLYLVMALLFSATFKLIGRACFAYPVK
jgi:polar amino acid transport system permease protein